MNELNENNQEHELQTISYSQQDIQKVLDALDNLVESNGIKKANIISFIANILCTQNIKE